MKPIVDADGYTLDERPRGKATDYALTYLVDGLEHQDYFDTVRIDGNRIKTVREIPRWGDAEVKMLDPGIMETGIGPALEAIARGKKP